MFSFQIADTNNSLFIVQTIVVYAIVMHSLIFWRYFATWALSNACPSCMWLCRRIISASEDLKLEELLLMRRAVGVYWCIFHCCTLSRVITIEKGTLLWLFWWVVGNLPNFLYSVTEGVYLLLWTHLGTSYICCVTDVYLAVILVFACIFCVVWCIYNVIRDFFFGSCYYFSWQIFSFIPGENISAGDKHRYP
jgi:hypothetical protein